MPAPHTAEPSSDYARKLEIKRRKKKRAKKLAKVRADEAHAALISIAKSLETIAENIGPI